MFLGFRQRTHFIICVKKRMGDQEWLLKATIDFAAFNSLVEEVHIGETGSAFIVNNEGELQSHSRTRPLTNILGLLRMDSPGR